MHITQLCADENGHSYFKAINVPLSLNKSLGQYSIWHKVNGMAFREFEAGLTYDWHNAPRSQFIIYLSGKVEVLTSSGESKTFTTGDVLYASDLTGQGHVTKTLTSGTSIIVAADDTEVDSNESDKVIKYNST